MSTSNLRRYFLFLVVALAAGACSGGGGCGGCALEDLPPGGIPGDQTLEGGAQIRISESGFSTITDILPAVITDAFNGQCIGQGGFNVGIGDIDFCHENDGVCSPGCEIGMNIDSFDLSVPGDNELELAIQFDIGLTVPVEFDPIIGGNSKCDIIATADNLLADVIVDFNIRSSDGELELNLLEIPDVNINLDIDASDCGTIIDAVGSLVNSIVNGLGAVLDVDFIRDLLTPLLEPLIQGLLPDPLGIEGVADLGSFIGDISPGTSATMEARVVPGGYVHLENGGLSLGIITGINADEDLSTRTPELDSEPALCVPPFAAPDYGVAPASLSQNGRGNFLLNPADLFRGIPETMDDVIIGASETMLDQVGHHVISSGAFCLSLGTELVPQLNLAAFGLLVPSMAELGTEEGNDPLLMVTRPAKPIDFTIGDGTSVSPSLTMHLSEFSIDFYAFLFERYTRGFTVTLDMNIGVNLEFGTDGDGNPTVLPILVGLEAENIGVSVVNEEFLREDKATIEAVFPSLLDLVLPLVTGSLDAFALPEIAGFKLDNLDVQRVTTSEDDFLGITARLGTGTMMRVLGQSYPTVALLAEENAPIEGDPTSASARLVDVIAPAPAAVRAAILGQSGGQEPGVVLDLDTHDAQGRELEWIWNIEGGLWRPLIKGGEVTLRDGAFNMQGRYQLQLRARPVGDYKSWDELITHIDVAIDSVGPRILTDSAERDDETLYVPTFDNVFEHDVEVAFGPLGSEAPATAWGEGTIEMSIAKDLATDGELRVFARDPQGNQSTTTVRISSVLLASANGGCSTGGGTGWAGLLLVLLALGVRARPGRLSQGSLLALILPALVAMTPACSCSGDPAGQSCMIDEDCLGVCEEGQIGQCFEEACRCLPSIAYGRMGEYSSMDLAPDGTVWVSGYNSTHGDLVVASTRQMGRIPSELWQFVDGVPEGPVVLPTFAPRGGIKAEGEDVGRYTDIAVASTGTAMVSYFDASTGSLKLAANYGDEWHKHVIDAGDLSADDATVTRIVGQYSSISIDGSDVPAIAYFAHTGVGTSEAKTEVRLAQATSSEPRSGGDWTIEVIDEAAVILEEEEADVLTIPYGTGLFVELVRSNGDLPIAAYYDRINGDLKLARYVSESAEFTVETLDAEGDVGWYPSVIVDADDTVHVSYVDADSQDLLYVNDVDLVPELVDDGYRIVGTTADGLPLPEFHFVGDDSSIAMTEDGPYISYQDATTHELLIAFPNAAGEWGHTAIAGDEDPFTGAYGFFANSKYDGTDLTMSSWVLDQANSDNWVELFKRAVVIE